MGHDKKRHHRKSIRLDGYDYSNHGAYFVTICVNYRRYLFSDIKDDSVILGEAGKMVQKFWYKLPGRFPNVELDE